MLDFSTDIQVSFGDCDPAGIVYYPNFLRWVDRAFHALLRETVGGHADVCRELGAQGLGLMNVEIAFKSPALEGDLMQLRIKEIIWTRKSYAVRYQARIGQRLVFEAAETRGIFIRRDGKMVAGDVAPLKHLFEQAVAAQDPIGKGPENAPG